MYIMNISNHNGKLSILIQNWEYRGIVSLRKRNVYGMYRSKEMKDFLVCYDHSCSIGPLKRLFHRTSQKLNINIRMEDIAQWRIHHHRRPHNTISWKVNKKPPEN